MPLTPDHTEEFQTMPRPKTGTIPITKRQLSRFEIWAWSPVMSFQVGLTFGYIALIYYGIAAFIASPPSFELTSPEGWANVWAITLILGAATAALGSISRHKLFERMETIGSSLTTLTVGSYSFIVLWIAYGEGDPDRIAAAAAFGALVVPTLIRTMWLYSQLLRK